MLWTLLPLECTLVVDILAELKSLSVVRVSGGNSHCSWGNEQKVKVSSPAPSGEVGLIVSCVAADAASAAFLSLSLFWKWTKEMLMCCCFRFLWYSAKQSKQKVIRQTSHQTSAKFLSLHSMLKYLAWHKRLAGGGSIVRLSWNSKLTFLKWMSLSQYWHWAELQSLQK